MRSRHRNNEITTSQFQTLSNKVAHITTDGHRTHHTLFCSYAMTPYTNVNQTNLSYDRGTDPQVSDTLHDIKM